MEDWRGSGFSCCPFRCGGGCWFACGRVEGGEPVGGVGVHGNSADLVPINAAPDVECKCPSTPKVCCRRVSTGSVARVRGHIASESGENVSSTWWRVLCTRGRAVR